MKRPNLPINFTWLRSLGLSLLLTSPVSHAALTDYTESQQQAYETVAASLSEQNDAALTAEQIEQVTYWVDAANGVDDFSRTGQIDQPWQSITWALNNIPFANDDANIVIREGTYSPSILYIGTERGGSAEEALPFNITAFPNEEVVLDGANVTEAMFSIADASNVSISGLTIRNITGAGKSAVYVANSNKITLANNSIHDAQWTTDAAAAESPTLADRLNGIAVVGTSSEITIENNSLYNLVTGYGEPILVVDPAVAVVSNNTTYDNDPEFFENQQYFVSPEGSDETGIGTFDQPWQTIHKALFSVPFGEDNATINIRGGTYQIPTAMFFDASRGGADGEYFTVKAYEDETVIVDGSLLDVDFGAMVSVSSGAYVRIEGLSFTNLTGPKSGIFITGTSHHVALINNKLFGMTWADDEGEDEAAPTPSDNLNPIAVIGNNATTSVSDITIRGNELYDIVPGYSEGIKIVGNVDGFLVEDNVIRDIANIGVVAAGNYTWVLDENGVLIPADVNHARNGIIRNNVVSNAVSPIANSAGIYLDGAHNVLVEGNISHSNSVGFSVGSEQPGTASGNILRNNLAYDNQDAGLVVGTVHEGAAVLDTLIEENEFKNNYRKTELGEYGGEVTIQQVDGLVIKGNSFESLSDVVVVVSQPATNIAMNDNSYTGLSNDPNALVFDWGGVTGTSYIGLDQFREETCLELASSVTECPVTEEPVVEEPIEEPVVEEPVDEPTEEDGAEDSEEDVVTDPKGHKHKKKHHKHKHKNKKHHKHKSKNKHATNDDEWDRKWDARWDKKWDKRWDARWDKKWEERQNARW